MFRTTRVLGGFQEDFKAGSWVVRMTVVRHYCAGLLLVVTRVKHSLVKGNAVSSLSACVLDVDCLCVGC